MTDEIVLDLGEYGEIIVESAGAQAKGRLVPAGRGGEERARRRVDASALLRAPLY